MDTEVIKLEHMPDRAPMAGTFELTVRCNLHCKMCLFRHHDRENRQIMERELSTSQWIDMAAQAAEAGTLQLLITGGEAMLRKDFCEIWEGIYQQGFLITLYTNATMVTPKIMETLRKYPPHKIGITIYGATPETYEKVCGQRDALERAIAGVHELQTLPSAFEFRTTIIKDNYPEADMIENLIHREFGSQYTVTQTRSVTKAVRGACADVEACRLEPEDNVKLAFRRSTNIIKKIVGDSYNEELVGLKYTPPEESCHQTGGVATLLGCDAGMSSYTISWDGKLLGCQMLGAFATDAVGQGLQTAWEQFPLIVKLPPINEKCQNCKSINICNCCYASRYAETGDLGGCPEYVCKDIEMVEKLLHKHGH